MAPCRSDALGIQSLMQDLGMEAALHIHTDSTAARGIALRKGVGKVRHIEVAYLWIQDHLAQQTFKLHKVLGTNNQADLFTKYVAQDLIRRYCDSMQLEFQQGRAESAPQLTAGSG